MSRAAPGPRRRRRSFRILRGLLVLGGLASGGAALDQHVHLHLHLLRLLLAALTD